MGTGRRGSERGDFDDEVTPVVRELPAAGRVERRALLDGDKIRVGEATVLRFAWYDALEAEFQRMLLESALRDGLTRAFNRRYFLERLAAEIAYAQRHHRPLSLLMIDIDHFK